MILADGLALAVFALALLVAFVVGEIQGGS